MQKKILILLAAFVVACVFAGAASAATPVNTNHVTTAKSMVGTATSSQDDPAIDGTRVVWEQTDLGTTTPKIMVKNTATGATGVVWASTQVQYAPDISGTKVVWMEHDPVTGSWQIMWRDISKNAAAQQVKPADTDQWDPAISGDRIVWEQVSAQLGTSQIFAKNVVTGASGHVSGTSQAKQYDPDINGLMVVYEQTSGGTTYIRFFTLNTGRTGWADTSLGDEQVDPVTDGTFVAYEDDDTDLIMVKNLVNGAGEAVVQNTGVGQWGASISQGRVGWTQDPTGTATTLQVLVKSLVSGAFAPLYAIAQDQWNTGISGLNIVWAQDDTLGGMYSIYWTNLSNLIPKRVTP
jgi:hypothetical protein